MLLEKPQMTKTYTQRCREKAYNQIVLKETHLIDIIKTHSEMHIEWWPMWQKKMMTATLSLLWQMAQDTAVCSQNLSGSVPGSPEQTYIMNTM